jgi:hypothetical protein
LTTGAFARLFIEEETCGDEEALHYAAEQVSGRAWCSHSPYDGMHILGAWK